MLAMVLLPSSTLTSSTVATTVVSGARGTRSVAAFRRWSGGLFGLLRRSKYDLWRSLSSMRVRVDRYPSRPGVGGFDVFGESDLGLSAATIFSDLDPEADILTLLKGRSITTGILN